MVKLESQLNPNMPHSKRVVAIRINLENMVLRDDYSMTSDVEDEVGCCVIS